MDVQTISAEPTEAVQSVKAEIPEWTKFAGNKTGNPPAGVEKGTPIAIRLRDGTELAVFAGDSFDLPMGDWDHADHEKDIVAYRLLSAEEKEEFSKASVLIKSSTKELEKTLDHCKATINLLKGMARDPLLAYMVPKLVAALRCPDGKYKGVAANASKSSNWVLQQTMQAFREPSKD
ncbi:hypothetical protein [Microbulbifer sp. 2205BS26-8]|uniref:hypothetical protein n=1 Tax=Microbulbifer sp. 2205BS26-8 TaxID=3064386 RepID=UPI00273D0435|nr:hypothetical protein [Microbulbifer sp. 2205BS26-8]MDP5208875.1 hypothetical protein [Microbulbifer sp. 2205BS26-8]